MSDQYVISVLRDVILVEVGPRLDDALLVEIGSAIRKAIAFQAGMDVILELSGVIELKLSHDAVLQAAGRARLESNRIAIVASSATVLGMASIYAALADPLRDGRIALVNELITAVDWLRAGTTA